MLWADIDGCWVEVLGEVAERGMRWSVALTFTYRPASALVTRFFTEDYLALAVPVALAVAAVLGACVSGTAAVAAARGSDLLVLLESGGEALGLPAKTQ